MRDITSRKKYGPEGPAEKTSKMRLYESLAQNENCGCLFIYIVLVIDYCTSQMVKISSACRALTISL
jgi:hypothetical protein